MKYKERNKESETERDTHREREQDTVARKSASKVKSRIHEHVVHKNDKFIQMLNSNI